MNPPRLALAVFFMAAGALHFIRPAWYLSILPPWVPFPAAAVYGSGFVEILLGALVLSSKTRRLAGWGLIVLLVAVFPANLHMALHPDLFPRYPAWLLWARLPLQAVLILWVRRACL